MTREEQLFMDVLQDANQARACRDVFDSFWKNNPSLRSKLHICYFLRHSALLNAFDNLLFLLCSKQMWALGGIGAWSCQYGVMGPLQPLSNGDQIDKIITIFNDHEDTVKALFAMHQTSTEKDFLEMEHEHIRKALKLFMGSLELINLCTAD